MSRDGSRIWTGQFWALNPARPREPELPFYGRALEPSVRPEPADHRSLGCGGLIAAVVLGVVLENLHFTLPYTRSLESAVSGMFIANAVYALLNFFLVVLILSVGRQGIDVLLLRCLLAGFLIGLGYFPWVLWYLIPGPKLVLVMFMWGLTFAVGYGVVFAPFAALANLLWYRSLRALRPQLPIFNRGSGS